MVKKKPEDVLPVHLRTGVPNASKVPSRSGVAERRVEARRPMDYNASCTLHSVSYNVEVIDLSRQGMRVRMRHGLLPETGQRIIVGMMNGRSLPCSVSWVNGIEIGLKLDEPIDDIVEVTHYDEMGSDFYKAVLKYQIANPGT